MEDNSRHHRRWSQFSWWMEETSCGPPNWKFSSFLSFFSLSLSRFLHVHLSSPSPSLPPHFLFLFPVLWTILGKKKRIRKHHCTHQVDLFLTWNLFSPFPHPHCKCIYRPDFMTSLWNHIIPELEGALKITEPHLYNCIKWLPGIRHSSKCFLQFYSLICTTTLQSHTIMIPIL